MRDTISTTGLKGALFASVTALFWGFLAIVLKVVVQHVPPATIVWFRFTLAFVMLFIAFAIFRPKQLGIIIRPPLMLLIAAIFLGMNYIGLMNGLHLTSPNNAQVFIQLGPILLAVSGIVIYKEKISWKHGAGFILVLLGLSFFYSQQVEAFADQSGIYNKGIGWIIFGAVSWAVYAVLQKKLVTSYGSQQLNLVIYGLPALLYIPFADFSAFQNLSWEIWGLLIFCGINTLVAYGTLALALRYLEAHKISVIITLNPIITFVGMAILGSLEVAWIMSEEMNLISIVGAALVLSGAVVVVFFRGKQKKA